MAIPETIALQKCPSTVVDWMRSPLGVMVASSLVALVCGLLVAPQGLVACAALAGAIAIGMIWPWLGLRGISCELQFQQPRGQEGTPMAVAIAVVNRWPWPVWGLTIENAFLVVSSQKESAAVGLARVAGLSRTEFCWNFVPERRGRYPTAPPRIACAFPFGLWKAWKQIHLRETVIVWPKTVTLPPFPLPAGQDQSIGAPTDARPGNEGDRTGVRAYRRGDSLRGIHWPLTARHDRFIVCERQGWGQTRVRLALDVEQAAPGELSPHCTREWSVRVAASICRTLVTQNACVSLEIGAERRLEAANESSLRRCLDQLATFDEAGNSALDCEGPRTSHTHSQTCELSLLVTDGETRGAQRRRAGFDHRVLLTAEYHRADREAGCDSAWIVLNGSGDVARDLHEQWSRRTQEYWRGP